MPEGNITILEIARILDISKSTVSRALKDSHDVSPATRHRVMELANQLGYRPNLIARQLKERKSRTLGVVIPSFMIPFYSMAISGIQNRAAEMGYSIITCQSNESERTEEKYLEILISSQVEGIILSVSKTTGKHDHIERVKKLGIPLVLFNRVIPVEGIPSVSVDDYQAAKDIVHYLVQTGCRDIAFLSGPTNLLLCQDRERGYKDALREAGIAFDSQRVVQGDFSLESGFRGALSLLGGGAPPEAYFCVCDSMAFGAMLAIKQKGFRIPEDISVAGFTNEPIAQLVDPPLTTVAQPAFEIGSTAVDLLMSLIRKESGSNEIRKVLQTRMIVRESTRG
jgi:DNA-binding LacI/PurR family transcriptional regulator